MKRSPAPSPVSRVFDFRPAWRGPGRWRGQVGFVVPGPYFKIENPERWRIMPGESFLANIDSFSIPDAPKPVLGPAMCERPGAERYKYH